MGRPPCCDKVGIKKGPWTPEEDIVLVSYIQEHGPGNWRSVPTNTGLLRCSKSCRLRWTNYLRPGIKRGNFTPHEEGMIIHLQALLGNKWAAIASYLPQRTDNDIKNYWNTHLKKKIKKFQSSSASDHHHHHPYKLPIISSSDHPKNTLTSDKMSMTDHIIAPSGHASATLINNTANSNFYASSTENISRLLQGWMKSSPKNDAASNYSHSVNINPKAEHQGDAELISNEEFESILSFDNLNSAIGSWDHKHTNSSDKGSDDDDDDDDDMKVDQHIQRPADHKSNSSPPPPLSFLEKWLLDEASTGQVEEMTELPSIF